MKNSNLDVLDEVNKGATMGMDAISFITDKVSGTDFKKTLDIEYNKYKDISRRINNEYPKYSDKEPHETNMMNKIMTKSQLDMKTVNDQSNSKVAEILLQGTNMGIIEGRKLLNNNPQVDENVKSILSDFVVMQEDSVETLKKFL